MIDRHIWKTAVAAGLFGVTVILASLTALAASQTLGGSYLPGLSAVAADGVVDEADQNPTGRQIASSLQFAQADSSSGDDGKGLFGPLTWPTQLDLETYRGNSWGAYETALKDKKYTMILFETDLCVFCKNLAENLADERFAKYSDRVVVAISDGEKDEGARQLVEALGVVRYPTLVILKTNNENIHVAGRMEGEVSKEEIERVMIKAMEDPIVTD